MPRPVEGSARVVGSPEDVWAVWTEPSRWVGGPIENAVLHDRFEVGGRYTTKVKGFRAVTATITEVEPARRWTG
jgi:uncharacterized protein YndB with AHSA1/START domain